MPLNKKFASIAVLGMLACTPASAVPIAAGSALNFGGGVAATGGSTISTAQGLDFLNLGDQGPGPGTITLSTNGTQSFSFLTVAACGASCGAIKDIASLSPFTAISAFYTITENGRTVTFDLGTLPVVARDTTLDTLTLSGFGMFHLDGFDDTPGSFILTAQQGQVTSFSASAAATSVPEPGSIAMLGAGLLGAGMVLRRRQD